MSHVHIIKRKEGHQEPYDGHKVYASCYPSCLNGGLSKEKADLLCRKVVHDVDQWVKGKRTIASDALFREIVRAIGHYSKDAAFMYETHRDIS